MSDKCLIFMEHHSQITEKIQGENLEHIKTFIFEFFYIQLIFFGFVNMWPLTRHIKFKATVIYNFSVLLSVFFFLTLTLNDEADYVSDFALVTGKVSDPFMAVSGIRARSLGVNSGIFACFRLLEFLLYSLT